MTTRVELAYLLRKHSATDRFDSDLPVQIPIQGQIRLMNEDEIEAAAGPNAIMGVRIQETVDKQIFKFVRRSPLANLVFPDISEENAKFRKLKFRILTSADFQGQDSSFAITYEIDNDDCRVVGENAPLGENWIALVTFQNGNFELLYKKGGGGPGTGDPCEEWNCEGTNNIAVKIKCILYGCT
jgi:hypothetical protein